MPAKTPYKPQRIEDVLLVQRLAAGDETALVDVMQRYGTAILTFVQRLTGDRFAAEEVCQDVFVKLWQQAVELRRDGYLQAWLYRVARNKAIDYNRCATKRTEELSPTLVTTKFLPEEEFERKAAGVWLRSAMKRLPFTYRYTIWLHYFERRTQQEIAALRGIPIGTVKSQVSHALRLLSKWLPQLKELPGDTPENMALAALQGGSKSVGALAKIMGMAPHIASRTLNRFVRDGVLVRKEYRMDDDGRRLIEYQLA